MRSASPLAAPAAARWHPRELLASPHRLGFSAGALMLAASAMWWLRVLPQPGAAEAVPRAVAHALWMSWGFMPLFIAGFLFTAGPRWLEAPAVPARALLPAIGAQVAGWLVFGLALADGGPQAPLMAGMGLAAVAAGWSHLVLRLWRLLRAGTAPERLHVHVVLAACALGALLLDATVGAVVAQAWTLALALTRAALWGCLGVVYAAALHRMVPFLGSAMPRLDARWPAWLLWTLVAALGLQALEQLAEWLTGPLPRPVRGVQALGQGVAAVLLLGLAWRWRRLPSLRQRLPAMLLRGFIWLGVALLLSALAQPAAALHAYVLGFLGTLLLAMASRLTCGQAGRAVVVDDLLWLLFRLQQFAVLARVAAALWPRSAPWLLPLAAVAWAGVALGWLLRYGRWLGRPRAVPRRG